MNTDYISGESEGEPIDESYDDLLAKLKDDELWGWSPPGVTARVAAQHSQFLFGRVTPQQYGSTWLPVAETDGIVLISTSPALKESARRFLRNALDIGVQTMFPDIGGFARAFGVERQEDPYRW